MNISDLDFALTELSAALKIHYEWVGKLLELSLLGGTPDADIIHLNSHELCRFSDWLRSYRTQNAQHEGELEAIATAHEAMHDCARELMHAVTGNAVNARLLRNYHEAQQRLVTCIDHYRQRLLVFRNLHDTLTGLPLRHLLYQDFEFIRARCCKDNQTLWLLMMDIDRFKSINDRWGHNAGDDVLRSVATRLKADTRQNEHIYRFGGEEFIMLLHVACEQEAKKAGVRICRHLASQPVTVNNNRISVTVTGGLTAVNNKEALHDAIGRADKAMYFGKNNGRNQCVMAARQGEMVRLI